MRQRSEGDDYQRIKEIGRNGVQHVNLPSKLSRCIQGGPVVIVISEVSYHGDHCTKNVAVPMRFEEKARLIKIFLPIGRTIKQVIQARL